MGIDLATWRARIGLNYYHMSHPLQTRWRSSGGRLYQSGMASWGVGEVTNDTPLVLKGCMTVVALSLILQYVVHSLAKLKGRGGGSKVHCHWRGSTSRVTGAVDGGGTLLLRAAAVVIPLLLVIAGDVEMNPGPEVTSMRVLLNALHPVRASWYKIGLELDIPHTELDCFEQKHSDATDLLCEVLKYWFKTAVEPRPTWEAVVTALRSRIVNEWFVAAQLESKYCTPVHHKTETRVQTTVETQLEDQTKESHAHSTPDSESPANSSARCSSSSSPPPSEASQKPPFGCGCGSCTLTSFLQMGCPVPFSSKNTFPYLKLSGLTDEQQESLRESLRFETRDIMMQFQELVSTTIKSLIRRNVSVDELVPHIMTLTAFDPVVKKPQVPLFQDCLEQLKAAGTISNFFLVLNDYISFFNYDIIEHIIKVLGTDEDKAELQKYKSNFNQYARRRIFECGPHFGPQSETGNADIFVKLDSGYDNYTVAETKGFCHKIRKALHLSSKGVLRLCQVEKGCFELTFQVPLFVQHEIFPLSSEQERTLKAEGVIKLTCGEYQFADSPEECQHDIDVSGTALTLKAAFNTLCSVCPKWYNVGVQLEVPTFQLKNIESKSNDSMDQLRDMLDLWISNNPSLSWKHLVDALKAPSVGEEELAKEVEEKYCGPRDKSCQSTSKTFTSISPERKLVFEDSITFPSSEGSQKPPFGCGCGKCTFFSFIESGCPTPIPSASSFPYLNISGLTQWQQQELKGRLRSESQEIMIKFQKLLSATIKSFQEQCVPLDSLVSQVMALKALDPVFKESQVSVFHHRFEELKAADTIVKVFMVLNNHFSFFNYHILENLIEELGTEEDKTRLQTYKQHFNQYAKRRVFECPSEFGPVSDAGHSDIFVKLDSQYENFTVAEIEVFCHKLSEIVHISSQGILCLCRVDKGCIELTFQVPSFVQQKIFPLSREQEIALEEEGVIKLKCGKYHFLSKIHELHTAQDQVQYFEIKFGSLVDRACQEVIGKTEPCVFLSIVTYLSTPTQHQSFIKEKLTNIPPPVTIVRIWSVLDRHWDFLNYGLLKHIINAYGSLELKKKMQNYVDELSTSKQQNQLSDFIKCSPCRDEGPPEEYLKLVVVKLNESSQCKLEDAESFKEAIVHKFFPPGSDILLQSDTRVSFCVCLTSPSNATHLQQNLTNIEAEFFKKHGIDAVTIDGQEIYLTIVEKYGGYLKELYSSEQCSMGIGPLTPAEKLLPFNLARIEKDKLKVGVDDDKFTTHMMRGDRDDVGSMGSEFYKKSPIKFEEVGKISSSQPKLILIEGAPGVGKTTFSWEFCRKWGRGEILQDHSLLLLLPLRDNNLKEARTLSDLFIHPAELQQAVVQEINMNQGQGVAIWLEAWDELDHEPREKASVFLDLIHGKILPHATVFVTSRPWASERLREKCGDRITQHVEILASAKDQIAHYINKAVAEAQPSSFAAKFNNYLSSNPAIRAAMYTPVTAKMAAEVFKRTESSSHTTMTELFTAFTIKTLVDHLHPVYHKQQLTSFSDLPTDVYKQFQDLCRMAYEGILNRQQLVFSAAHLPTGFAPLGLMQEVPQLYPEGRASSYHFIHLTLQEYLAAVHISQLPAHEQTRLFQEHFDSGHFKMTIKFSAGLTKLANMPPDITKSLVESDETKLTYFHFLFEAKDILVITESLGLDEIVVRPHYSWTPLDYYVTGHAISHSNCSWRLLFKHSSIDDEKFELFCKGCAAALQGTGCRGHIVHANFSENSITSKGIQSFVNIPPCIIQKTTELELHHNKLDGSACDMLAKSIPSMSSLRRLWLSFNPIESGGAVEVIKALSGSEVKQLLLDNTRIGVPDCEALCELLKSNCSLEELKTCENNFSSESVASIITELSHNSSLVDLDVSNSHFSLANVISLGSVLKDRTSDLKLKLKMLNLQDCHISSKGAVELAAGLCKNTTLTNLNLSHNPIGVHLEGVTAVAELLEEVGGDHSKVTLTHLVLRNCHIGGQGARELAAALCKNSTLKHLNLNHNHIGVEGASSISDMLQHNTSLEVLHLRNDSVGEEGVHQLINSLKHNQTLRELYLPKTYKTENGDHRIEWW